MNNKPNLLQKFAEFLSPRELEQLKRSIEDEKAKPPKIAIIGKSGVGKTSTINVLFNAEWKISHTVAGTKNAQRKEFQLQGGGMLEIIDMPGLGEDIDADVEYIKLYKEILPTVDIVLYVVQANAKDMSEDQNIIQDLLVQSVPGVHGKIVIGLNQVDKIGPGEWNLKLNLPSPEQQQSIDRRSYDIIDKLHRFTKIKKDRIIPYSATRRYNLLIVLNALIASAGKLGWKLPINPADPFELADPIVQQYIQQNLKK